MNVANAHEDVQAISFVVLSRLAATLTHNIKKLVGKVIEPMCQPTV